MINYKSNSESDIFRSSKLGQVFDNTSASYKFYWLLGILDLLAETNSRTLDISEIQLRMVSRAFIPVAYFRLSLGKQDNLQDVISILLKNGLPLNAKRMEIESAARLHAKLLKSLGDLVPTRFLSPWINRKSSIRSTKLTIEIAKQAIASQSSKEPAPYSVDVKSNKIYINQMWAKFLLENKTAIEDFTKLRLVRFLEARNPHSSNITSKLELESKRDLTDARKFWGRVLEAAPGELTNIYTNKPLITPFAVDHFIPFSFIAHDLLWNLIPTDTSSNSSKSDMLPQIEKYLLPFTRAHHLAIAINHKANSNSVDDYRVAMAVDDAELLRLTVDQLSSKFRSLLTPRIEQAKASGF
jgi:hypothetical protein